MWIGRLSLLLLVSALAVAGCAGRRAAEVEWDPADVVRQTSLREGLRAEGPEAEMYGYHPLLVVPPDRLFDVFPALHSDDQIVRFCKASFGTVAEFTPEVRSPNTVRTKVLRCQDHADLRSSTCELVTGEALYAGDPRQYFHVAGDLDAKLAEKIVRLFRSSTAGEAAGTDQGSRSLGGAWVRVVSRKTSAPNRFEVGLEGCGCAPTFTVEILGEPERLGILDGQLTCN